MHKKTIVACVMALFIGIGIGMISQNSGYAEKKAKEPYERLDTFAQVLSLVERNYVDETDRTAMVDGAIRGMIRSLDPHSSFMSASERSDFEHRTSGQFVGVGIEIGLKGDELRVISAFYGGPAHRAGIESGDILLAVNGRDVSKMSLDELFNSLRGEVGSKVKLTIRHAGKMGIQNYDLERAVVQLDVIQAYMLDLDYGYVALKTFGNGSAAKVKAEIERLSSYRPNGLKGLVLDLRKNPGGFLNEGVELANLFIKSGNIVSTRGRDGVSIQNYDASIIKHAFDMPLAVIIDEGSASASEIVAGALQDHRRAVIVGQTSFGKASIQNLFTLKDGSSVKLTIGRYYTPSGKCIQAQGIVPDVEVEDLEMYVKKRTITREKDLENALGPNGPVKKDEKGSENEEKNALNNKAERRYEPGDPFPAIDDLQLFTALQQLRAREFFYDK